MVSEIQTKKLLIQVEAEELNGNKKQVERSDGMQCNLGAKVKATVVQCGNCSENPSNMAVLSTVPQPNLVTNAGGDAIHCSCLSSRTH